MNQVSDSAPLDIVDTIYAYLRAEREKHRREEGVVWVTDLLRCPLKRAYEEKYPELMGQDAFKPVLILGHLVHHGVEGVLKEVLKGYEVEREVEFSREVIVNGSVITLKGRLDILINDGEKQYAVEIKSSQRDKGLPHQHHVDQARAYNWLANLEGTILLYVTPNRITQFYVDGRMDSTEVIKRITSRRAPRYSWECSYCVYSVMCPYKVEE